MEIKCEKCERLTFLHIGWWLQVMSCILTRLLLSFTAAVQHERAPRAYSKKPVGPGAYLDSITASLHHTHHLQQQHQQHLRGQTRPAATGCQQTLIRYVHQYSLIRLCWQCQICVHFFIPPFQSPPHPTPRTQPVLPSSRRLDRRWRGFPFPVSPTSTSATFAFLFFPGKQR